jgi:hypothetical protein
MATAAEAAIYPDGTSLTAIIFLMAIKAGPGATANLKHPVFGAEIFCVRSTEN